MTETKWIEFSDTPKIGHGISRGGMIMCANGWIPVSEQLPDDFQMVVVFWYEKGKPMADVAFWQEDARRFDGEKWVLMKDTVIFWMPLPEKVAEMKGEEDETGRTEQAKPPYVPVEMRTLVEVVRCEECRHANECHKNVQYTRHELNSVTIGYSPIEWCSRGGRRIDGRFNKQTGGD